MIRNTNERNRQSAELKGSMDRLNNDKKALDADQAFKDALKNMGMIRDYIDYDFIVEKDAPIRKMWAPKLFDDKGKPRDMTKEERAKYKGDPKLVGWVAKLENMERGTSMTVKFKHYSPLTEPDREMKSPGLTDPGITDPDEAATTKKAPSPNDTVTTLGGAVGDTAASKKQKMREQKNSIPTLDERPLVIIAIAERDPNEPLPTPKAPAPVRKY